MGNRKANTMLLVVNDIIFGFGIIAAGHLFYQPVLFFHMSPG